MTPNTQTDRAKKSLARLLAAILLITGTVVVLSATASFALHIVVPIAALLVLGILIARAILNSNADKPEPLGSDIARFSRETVSEAALLSTNLAKTSAIAIREASKGAKEA
jgi:hypothetical protein